MSIEINLKNVVGTVIWLFLYLGYSIPNFWMADRIGQNLLTEDYYLFALSPIILLTAVFLVERIIPFKKDWNTIDMDSLNNILYLFTSNYAEAVGKSLALLTAPLIISLFASDALSLRIWPNKAPEAIQVIIGILIYDLIYYWYHRWSHKFNMLWRLHRLHHSVQRLTGLALARFNTLDLMIELALLTSVLYILGVPENIYLKMSAFMIPATILSHANFSSDLPKSLSWLIINPNSHRIHHSSDSVLVNCNFGGFTHLWDRIFGTYVEPHSVQVHNVGVIGHETSKWFWKQHIDFLLK